jgi:acetyl esterase
VVAGDSAGGNLAAAVAMHARDLGGPRLAGQVLIYPGLGGDMARGSYIEQAAAPGLTTADVAYYKSVYIGPPEAPNHSNKLASPLKETRYADLPPAFLVAAHWDPLRDDCTRLCRQADRRRRGRAGAPRAAADARVFCAPAT